jgi:hypothetical protein
MNAITVNTFPGVNSFTSARSWFLALIVVLHVGVFLGAQQRSFDRVFRRDPAQNRHRQSARSFETYSSGARHR